MKSLSFERLGFNLTTFLDALHHFSLQHFGSGNPLPAVSGGTVYFDAIDLIEALESDEEGQFEEVPDDTLARLELGLPVFGYFALSNGAGAFDCVDGQEVEVPDLDDEKEDDESEQPRRRRTKKYVKAVSNTTCNENSGFGFLIDLNKDNVEITGYRLSDISGNGELERMEEPNLLSEAMKQWVKSFAVRQP